MSSLDVLLALDEDQVKPGWVAFAIVIALCVALFFIMRSFAKHVRKASQPWEGEVVEPASTDEAPHRTS
ncbi:hypothetical protein BH09ACT10_BH09ACT10_29950 [soil metagenome]